MEPQTVKSAPNHKRRFTLYHFCARHSLFLDDRERSAAGAELSMRANELKLPVKKVRERIRPGEWSQSRLYPEWFLNDWLARYTKAEAERAAAAVAVRLSSEPQPAV